MKERKTYTSLLVGRKSLKVETKELNNSYKLIYYRLCFFKKDKDTTIKFITLMLVTCLVGRFTYFYLMFENLES